MEGERRRGRQKVEMKRIENEEGRYATFSKRREGAYKKASELCTSCDIDISVVIFSPTGKALSFAHPTMDNIINRFLKRNLNQNDSASLIEAHVKARILELNRQNNELIELSTAAKENGQKIDGMIASRRNKSLWGKPLHQLTKEEGLSLIAWLEDTLGKMSIRFNELKIAEGFAAVSSSGPGPRDAAGPSHGHGTMPF